MDKILHKKRLVIAVTGSSGAGTSTVQDAFGNVLRRENIKAINIEGDSFHKYNRQEMKVEVEKATKEGKYFSHFSADANILNDLAELFKTYRETGTGKIRHYIHSKEDGQKYGIEPGNFTPWEDITEDSDILFYEGLHGGVPQVLPYVDLLIGVVPVINLEWIQKIHRDKVTRGYTAEEVVRVIRSRMDDYIEYITPQFRHTHINFQRVPLVDTSNPFMAREVPTMDESMVVIRIKKNIILKYDIDLVWLKQMIEGSFITRRNTLVIPGPKFQLAMEIIITPVLQKMMEK